MSSQWCTTIFISCVLTFYAGTANAIDPIPRESGSGGFVNLGAGYNRLKSNMIAGTKLSDLGSGLIDSIHDEPEGKSAVTPVLNFELNYTFAGTRTQPFVGSQLEDLIRYDLTTQAGIRQELPGSSIVALSYVFSGAATEVWEDPYIEGQKREKTDRESSGGRFMWDKIFGSELQLRLTYREIDIGDEESGKTFLGLPGHEAELLDREGGQYEGEVLYRFVFQKKHRLAPAFRYTRFDLDGGAMSSKTYDVQITYGYNAGRWVWVLNGLIGYADYDEENPIYGKTRDDTRFGGNIVGFYHQPFGYRHTSLVGYVALFGVYSNIDFYNSRLSTASLSIMYRF